MSDRNLSFEVKDWDTANEYANLMAQTAYNKKIKIERLKRQFNHFSPFSLIYMVKPLTLMYFRFYNGEISKEEAAEMKNTLRQKFETFRQQVLPMWQQVEEISNIILWENETNVGRFDFECPICGAVAQFEKETGERGIPHFYAMCENKCFLIK